MKGEERGGGEGGGGGGGLFKMDFCWGGFVIDLLLIIIIHLF